MIYFIFFLLTIAEIFSNEIPCRKLYTFGNSIQNKVVLSPVIIVGQRGMIIPIKDDLYKATIDIKRIIKGSLENWKSNLLIAGQFSLKNDSNNICEFNSNEEENIYFLQALSSLNGEYNILFNPEIANIENLEIINKTNCINCAGVPKLFIKEESITEHTMYLDCTTESEPPSLIKWTDSNGRDLEYIKLRNGLRLNIKSIQNTVRGVYVCAGANVLGETTTSIIIKAKLTPMSDISRCVSNDKHLCNDHGKCYKDKILGGSMFCRCDPGYLGSHCTDNPNRLSDSYLKRSSNLDKEYCNANGNGYTNVVTNKFYCICNEGYFGIRCSKNDIRLLTNRGRMMHYNGPHDDFKYSSNIRKMVEESSSKASIKYIIIGATIVLGGCIIIILVIITVWKCYEQKSTRKVKKENSSSQRTNGLLQIPLSTNDEKRNFVPINLEINHKVTNTRSEIMNTAPLSDNPQFSGEGIYEGVNTTSN